MVDSLAGMRKYVSPMSDDLIGTAGVAERLGVTVATVNRWAKERRLQPAVKLPGRTGARLYRLADVEAYEAARGGEAA